MRPGWMGGEVSAFRPFAPLGVRLMLSVWLLGGWACPGRSQTVAYHNDFQSGAWGGEKAPGVTAVWSPASTDTTPSGRIFLGQFGAGTVTLSMANLPAHSQVNVAFDLYIIQSWDGSEAYAGPDVWELAVTGGPTLLRTTFSNWDDIGGITYNQAYPGSYPADDYPPRAGAVEVNTLGYLWAGMAMDSVYSLSFTLPHTASSLQLSFSAIGHQAIGDESWGIDNIRICVSDAPPARLPADAKKLTDGSAVAVADCVVTAIFGDSFYIENPDRSSGIRVKAATGLVALGQKVRVQGAMRTDLDFERYIQADAAGASVTGFGWVRPLAMGNRWLSGSDFFYDPAFGAGQRGVADAIGPNNVGLLVRTFGLVTAVEADGFYIDDGSHRLSPSAGQGVKVLSTSLNKPAVGRVVAVTGISALYSYRGVTYSAVRTRTQSDIVFCD